MGSKTYTDPHSGFVFGFFGKGHVYWQEFGSILEINGFGLLIIVGPRIYKEKQ